MGRFLKYALLVATVLLCVSAQPLRADTVDQFTYIAGGNTFFWELPPSPTTLNFSSVGTGFSVLTGFTENGVALSGEIFFFNAGGFEIDTTIPLASPLGDKLYMGFDNPLTFIPPTFIPGLYSDLIDQVSLDPNGTPGILTIAEVQVAPVPEPSTLVLLGSGLLIAGLGLAIKKASS